MDIRGRCGGGSKLWSSFGSFRVDPDIARTLRGVVNGRRVALPGPPSTGIRWASYTGVRGKRPRIRGVIPRS